MQPETARLNARAEPGVINARVYADGKCVADIAIDEAGTWVMRPGHVVWIGLFEPSPFRKFHPAQIRIVRQNHRIIESDVCRLARAWNVRRRPVQVAVGA